MHVLAVLFGVGAALTLDEFALWLRLDDVCWTREGRSSVDAVLVALVVGCPLLLGPAGPPDVAMGPALVPPGLAAGSGRPPGSHPAAATGGTPSSTSSAPSPRPET